MNTPFLSPPPKVTLVKGFGSDAFDNAVATARTCYNSRIITAEDVRKDEKSRTLRDRIAKETFEAGHHTTIQHATFQFTLEHVSRQAIWSFLHSHPFYNSEQVSQRYVEVKAGNVVLPNLEGRALQTYRTAVEGAMRAYQQLIALLTPRVTQEYYGIFKARQKKAELWNGSIKKRAQEVARYVLPIGTFAHLYHTVSGLTLFRYHRLCQQMDVPTETRLMVQAMVDEVNRADPLFFRHLEDPLPIESTIEHQALASLGRLKAGSAPKAYLREFDAQLGPLRSKLVDWKARGPQSVAQGVRDVLGATMAELPDAQALEQVLSPMHNRYFGESLVLTTLSKLTRALGHAHYTFQKKLSHTADSQDQRHRMTPASRPVLHAHFVPGDIDVVVPELIDLVPEARALFDSTMIMLWRSIEQLLDDGVSEEMALYLLPNAFPVRFLESGDLLHLHHKWVHRLCYTAQDEIWRASREETLQVRDIQPELARYIEPPCTLRKQAGITPFCPEGSRFCGIPVWNLKLEDMRRVL
ncbi:MAG: FAD-dependent thymidylate synthase [Myxococcaceae bacterium]|nr:FAD-dependent thymidylate synthase [Myxococcaceae bacterium]